MQSNSRRRNFKREIRYAPSLLSAAGELVFAFRAFFRSCAPPFFVSCASSTRRRRGFGAARLSVSRRDDDTQVEDRCHPTGMFVVDMPWLIASSQQPVCYHPYVHLYDYARQRTTLHLISWRSVLVSTLRSEDRATRCEMRRQRWHSHHFSM